VSCSALRAGEPRISSYPVADHLNFYHLLKVIVPDSSTVELIVLSLGEKFKDQVSLCIAG